MRKSLIKDENGMAMVLVIMAMLVLSLLSMATLSMASSNVNNSVEEREFQSSFYIAEAGMNYHTEVLSNKNIKEAFDNTTTADDFFFYLENNVASNTTYSTDIFKSQPEYNPSAEVSLKRLDMTESNPRTYAVVSRGITENSTRTVTKKIVIKWSPGFDASNAHAIYSRQNMLINGEVNGTLGSSNVLPDDFDYEANPIPAPIEFGWSTRVGDYYVPGDLNDSDDPNPDVKIPGWYDRSFYGERKQMSTVPEYNLPEFPVFPDVSDMEGLAKIESGSSSVHLDLNLTNPTTYLERIELDSSSILTINLGGEDRILIVDDINIAQGHIVLENGGSLKIYVSGNLLSGGDAVVNHPDPPANYKDRLGEEDFNNIIKDTAKNASEDKIKDAASKLSIFVKGEKTIDFNNNITLYGSLYGEKANINMGNSAKIAGNIITGGGQVNVDGRCSITSTMIYAPLAEVNITGSGEINGPVISNTTILSGGGKVEFNPDDDELFDDDIFPKEAKIISEGSVLEN